MGAGLFASSDYTPWDFLMYNRSASNEHRVSIYNRDDGSLVGADFQVANGFMFSGKTPRLIVVTWEGTDSLELYLDGTLFDTNTASGAWQTATGGTRLRLMRAPSASSSEYDYPGQLHGAWVWNRKLSVSEIRKLATDPFGMFYLPERVRIGLPPTGGAVTITLVAATVVSSAEVLIVSIAVIVTLVTVVAVAAAQVLIVNRAALAITLLTSTAASAAQVLIVNRAALAVTLLTSTAVSSAEVFAIDLAGVTILVTATAVSSAEVLLVSIARLVTLVPGISPATAQVLIVDIFGAVVFGRIPDRPTQATIPSYANRSNKR